MQSLDQAIEKVIKGIERSVVIHGDWRDYSLRRMVYVILVEGIEVGKALMRGDLYGPHGVVNELRDLAVTCIKAMCVLSNRKQQEQP